MCGVRPWYQPGKTVRNSALPDAVRDLVATQVPGRRAVDGGVVAERVAVPDLDVGLRDRLAGLRVEDREADQEWESRLALGDVAPRQVLRDPVGARRHLGREDAGRHGRSLRFVARDELERSRSEDGGQPRATGRLEDISSAQLAFHVRFLSRSSGAAHGRTTSCEVAVERLCRSPGSGPRAYRAPVTHQQRLTLLAAILGSGVAAIDGTIVSVALPAIENDLGGGLSAQQWISNAYLLTLASLILIGGSLGDIYGERRVFSIGVAAFGVMSVGCALAPTTEVLIAARALQGAAGALLTPSALAIIVAAFPPDRRSAAIGSWTAWGGIATIAGPFSAAGSSTRRRGAGSLQSTCRSSS